MTQDFAYGGVVFKIDEDSLKVLLVKKPHFTSWDLPKGHKNEEESDEEGALRELQEETGYRNIKFLGEPIVVKYEVEKESGKIEKIVTFFIGEHEGEESPQANPDDDMDEQGMIVEWVPVEEALESVTFPPFKSALEQAFQKYQTLS